MRLSIESQNAATDAVTGRLAGGTLRLYSGDTPQTPDDVPGGTLLVELRWSSPAFPPAQNGMATSFPLASAVALASGNPTYAHAVTADDEPAFDELVNQPGGLQIDPAWIEAGGAVVVDSITYSACVGYTL